MNNFKKLLQISITMFAVAVATSACGSDSGSTQTMYLPFIPKENTISVQINDSLNQDKIATADFYYRPLADKGKLSKSMQENDKAATNVSGKGNSFDMPVPDGVSSQDIKMVAIITYDSQKNVLDYWSSYDGVESQNDSFSIDFQSSKDINGFAGGSGTEEDPYLISQPRHFANISAQDGDGNYTYFDKNFKQTENIDLSNLTGLKFNRTEDDKDITFDKSNPWAPFYNEGHGVKSVGVVTESSSSMIPGMGNQNNGEDSYKNYFKGNYDGNNLIIDGVHIINPNESSIALFTGTYNATLKNITIGENSIVLLDGVQNVENLNISALSSTIINTTVENCTNNSKIIVKNLKNVKSIAVSGISTEINTESEDSEDQNTNSLNNNNNSDESEEETTYEYTNCVNKANICVYNNNIEKIYVGGCFARGSMSSMDPSSMSSISSETSMSGDEVTITKCKNSGNIRITSNKTSNEKAAIVASGISVNISDMDMGGMMGGNTSSTSGGNGN